MNTWILWAGGLQARILAPTASQAEEVFCAYFGADFPGGIRISWIPPEKGTEMVPWEDWPQIQRLA